MKSSNIAKNTEKKSHKRLIISLASIGAICGIVVGVAAYNIHMDEVVKNDVIAENKNIVKSDWKKFGEDNSDSFDRENKMNVLKETIFNRDEYKKNSKTEDDKDVTRENKYYGEVTENYNTYIEKMRAYFVSEYDTTLSDNTLSDDDIKKSEDKDDLNKKRTNLETLKTTIESESSIVFNEKDEKKNVKDYDEKIDSLTKKYSDRVSAIEEAEKKKAEEAAKKAEEERKAAVAAAAAQNNTSNSYSGGNNYNYSNNGSSNTYSNNNSGNSSNNGYIGWFDYGDESTRQWIDESGKAYDSNGNQIGDYSDWMW